MTENHGIPPGRTPGGGTPEDEALVERLVRLADRGPSPSRAETEALKARLRPLWLREVRARSRRRLAWTGGVLAAAAAVVIAVSLAPRLRGPEGAVSAPVATVTTVVGRAGVTPPSAVRREVGADAVGRSFSAGTVVETKAAGGMALLLTGGSSLRLDASTRLQLDGAAAVTLDQGALYVDSGTSAGGLVVRTAFGEARDVGTQFETRLEGAALTVSVREGAVELTRGGERVTVDSGFAVTVAPGRAAERRPIAAWAEEWSWTQRLAPHFEVEGRSAGELVAWVERECGKVAVYADAPAAARAREAVLHGDLVGSTPLETLATVLPGCGLQMAVEEGRFVVSLVGARPAGPRAPDAEGR
ncbi:MAG: FecR family protein [Acidobacteriota bacterium]